VHIHSRNYLNHDARRPSWQTVEPANLPAPLLSPRRMRPTCSLKTTVPRRLRCNTRGANREGDSPIARACASAELLRVHVRGLWPSKFQSVRESDVPCNFVGVWRAEARRGSMMSKGVAGDEHGRSSVRGGTKLRRATRASRIREGCAPLFPSSFIPRSRCSVDDRVNHRGCCDLRTTEVARNFRGERGSAPFCRSLWAPLAIRIGGALGERCMLLQTNGRQLRAICRVHIYIHVYMYAGTSSSCLRGASSSLVFMGLFGVALPPRGRYIDCRVIVSAQRPETQV